MAYPIHEMIGIGRLPQRPADSAIRAVIGRTAFMRWGQIAGAEAASIR